MKKFIFVFLLMDFVCLLSANAQWGNGDHIDKVLERKRKEAEANSSRTSNNTSSDRSVSPSSKTSSAKSNTFNESVKNKVQQNRDAKNIADRIDNFKGKGLSVKSSDSHSSERKNEAYKNNITEGLFRGQAAEDLKTVHARSINARNLIEKDIELGAEQVARTFIDLKKLNNTKSQMNNTSRNSNRGNVNIGVSSYNSGKKNNAKNSLSSSDSPKPNNKNASNSPVNNKRMQIGEAGKENGLDKKKIQTGIQNSKKPLRSGAELWKAREREESLSPEEDAKLNKWLDEQKKKTYN